MKNKNWKVLLYDYLFLFDLINKTMQYLDHIKKETENDNICITLNELIKNCCNIKRRINHKNDKDIKEVFKKCLGKINQIKLIQFDKQNELITECSSRFNLFHVAKLLNEEQILGDEIQSISRIENEVFKYIRGELILNSKVIDNFRILSNAFNDIYRKSESHVIQEKELKTLLENKINNDYNEFIIDAFIEVAIAKRIFEIIENDNSYLKLKGKCDYWFFLIALFGLPIEIENLGFMFFGKFPIFNGLENNILIKGCAGIGKTILASNISFEISDKSGFVLYFTFEEDIDLLENMYSSFGWINNNILYKKVEYDSFDSIKGLIEEIDNYAHDAIKQQKGLFMLIPFPPINMKDTFNLFNTDFYKLIVNIKYDIKLLVFDPISALYHENDSLKNRSLKDEFYFGSRISGISSIFITESEQVINDFEENICDTVINLSYYDRNYILRTLEVEKCRLTPCLRGKNKMTINAGVGVKVFPGTSAINTARRQREFGACKKFCVNRI